MAKLVINVGVDLSPLTNLKRYTDQNKARLTSIAADRYIAFLRRRNLRLSGGGGEWPPLKPETVDRKKRRKVAKNPNWILREYEVLLRSIGKKRVGNRTFVGFVQNTEHPRGPSVIKLAAIHQKGLGRVPRRRVIIPPSIDVRQRMFNDIRREYNRETRRNRKK